MVESLPSKQTVVGSSPILCSMNKFEGYKWITVKQFKFDPAKSWEENYKLLEQHHIEETQFLIDTIRFISKNVETI